MEPHTQPSLGRWIEQHCYQYQTFFAPVVNQRLVIVRGDLVPKLMFRDGRCSHEVHSPDRGTGGCPIVELTLLQANHPL